MTVSFHCDDPGYSDWLDGHSGGCVLSTRPNGSTGYILHEVGCPHLYHDGGSGGSFTERYIKVCAEEVSALKEWARRHRRRGRARRLRRCPRCRL
jgi:hypothetical protein